MKTPEELEREEQEAAKMLGAKVEEPSPNMKRLLDAKRMREAKAEAEQMWWEMLWNLRRRRQ